LADAGSAHGQGKKEKIKSGGRLGGGADRDICAGNHLLHITADGIDAFLDFLHQQLGVELEEDFNVEMGAGTAGADFMESVEIIHPLYEVAENTQLGGFFHRGIQEIPHRGGGHGPSRMEHEKDADEGGERVEVPAPVICAEKISDEKGSSHGGIKTGFGKPETGLGLHDGGGLLSGEKTSTEKDSVPDQGIEGENTNSGDGSLGHARVGKMVGGTPGHKHGGYQHQQADRQTDQVFQFTDAVGEAVIRGAAYGANGEESRQDGEEIGEFFQDITHDGYGVGEIGRRAHEGKIQEAEEEGRLKAAFTGSGWVGAVHGQGW